MLAKGCDSVSLPFWSPSFLTSNAPPPSSTHEGAGYIDFFTALYNSMPTSLLAFARSQFQVLWIFASLNHRAADDFESPELTTSMTIGITVAIAGNVLIALALNLQKLAHSNVSRRGTALENDNLERTSFDEHDDVFRERHPVTPRRIPPENQNLLQSTGARRNYGSGSRHSPADRQVVPKTTLASRVIPLRIREKLHNVLGVGRFREEDDRIRSQRPEVTSNGNPARDKRTATSQQKSVDEESESDYLKSKLWYVVCLELKSVFPLFLGG